MSLNTKLTVSLLVVVLVFCGMLGPVLQRVLGPSFEGLEVEEASEDADRVIQFIETEIEALDRTARDWATWDDCHDFASGVKPDFVEANIYDGVEESLDLVLLLIADLDGNVLLDFRKPREPYEDVELTALPSNRLPPDSPLLRASQTEQPVIGLLQSEWGPLMVSARPVLRNDSVGPVAGTLVMVRSLDETRVTDYRSKTHVMFRLLEPQATLLAELDSTPGSGSIRASAPVSSLAGRSHLNVRSLLRDVAGRAVAVLEAQVPRSITARGELAIRSAWTSTFVAGLLLLAVLYVLIQRSVVEPLKRFTRQALTLRPRAEVIAGLDLERRDEVGALSRRFAEMLTEIDEYQNKLADTSREAGMSEVATNVLHNVGNMLNSVSVSASLVQEHIAKLPSPQLAKIASLMRAKGADLGNWVTHEPAGQRLTDVLSALEQMLSESHFALERESREIAQHIGEVSQLIRSQQSLAGKKGHVENVTLEDEVEKALCLLEPGRNGIAVERRFAKIAPVATERQKLLQVFVNLTKNAIEAFDGLARTDKRIEVSVAMTEECVQVTFRDNAIGIAPDDLAKIFQHGFTTKATGHGFGLHSAANAMTELGGSLRVESDGPDCGASFIVELPVTCVRRSGDRTRLEPPALLPGTSLARSEVIG